MLVDPVRFICCLCIVLQVPSSTSGEYSHKTEYIKAQMEKVMGKHPHESYHKRHSHHHSIHNRHYGLVTTTTTESPYKKFKDDFGNHIDWKNKHYSKFPKLDSVMNRLNHIKPTTERTTTTTVDPLDDDTLTDEDYEEMDYPDKFEDENSLFDDVDDSDWEENDTDLEDDDEYLGSLDDDSISDDEEIEDVHFDSGYQAEEGVHKPSPMTEYKMKHFGTQEGVTKYRNNLLFQTPLATLSERDSALQHFVRMAEATCNKPMPRVIQVQSIHPNPAKTYMPHCTVLHRCGDDTGCCTGTDKKCAAKETQIVDLYFLVRDVSIKTGHANGFGRPEKLSFVNHTKCECMDKNFNTAPESLRVTRSELSTRCKCPDTFTPLFSQSVCTCDCLESNYDCLRMKKGKEHFSLTDRVKILNNAITPPKCEYGIYDKNAGRCPRRQDKFEIYAKTPTS